MILTCAFLVFSTRSESRGTAVQVSAILSGVAYHLILSVARFNDREQAERRARYFSLHWNWTLHRIDGPQPPKETAEAPSGCQRDCLGSETARVGAQN